MKPLVIVGDSLLDIDVAGSAMRLSPEAPVPVVEPDRVWQRPGGAGLAAVLASRGYPHVVLITAGADDPGGRSLARLFADDHPGIRVLRLPLCGTTVSKVRIRADGQSVVRLDHGEGYAENGALPPEVAEVLADAAAICVADYGRGVAANDALRAELTALADRIPVVWDPHPRGTAPIVGCALICPNQAEAQLFSKQTATNRLADDLQRRWRADAVSVTLGARGAVFADRRVSAHYVDAPQVAAAAGDTCGAGDRFSVSAATSLAAGNSALEAVSAAVADASYFIAAGGAAGVSSTMPLPGPVGSPVSAPAIGLPEVTALIDRVRGRGGTLVATGGCFDLLHTGHVRLLRKARDLGDALVVLINSDDSVRELKGPDRPIMSAEDRARVLAALACVDGVAIFDELSPTALLDRLRPDIWVKGSDYSSIALPEEETVHRHGGQVMLLPTVPGYSSSQLIAAAQK